jgi:LysM repeat protein
VQRTRSFFGYSTDLSLSPAVSAFDRIARCRPRYLLHGVVAAISVAALSSIAFLPRAVPAPLADAAPDAESMTPPLMALAIDTPPVPTPTQVALAAGADMLEATIAPPEPPKPTTHTVEDGESVRMLAARFGLSPETIMAANGLRNPDLLQVGQDLVILPTASVCRPMTSFAPISSAPIRTSSTRAPG